MENEKLARILELITELGDILDFTTNDILNALHADGIIDNSTLIQLVIE
jgi:predicted house-cleaning noncanonical NTP pyrophosphatase (MazG superfamily)